MEIALKLMRETSNPVEENYFYSGIYGAIHRLYNLEYSKDLIFFNVL